MRVLPRHLVGSPAGGTWSVESGGGSISGTTYTPADVASDTSVTVRYTMAASGSCAATTADISFTVNQIQEQPSIPQQLPPSVRVIPKH